MYTLIGYISIAIVYMAIHVLILTAKELEADNRKSLDMPVIIGVILIDFIIGILLLGIGMIYNDLKVIIGLVMIFSGFGPLFSAKKKQGIIYCLIQYIRKKVKK